MPEDKEQLPLDAKLLSLAIIELNISRRNVAIYPENHPSIKQSIDRAYRHLQNLFDIRNEITLAVAKDTLVIDQYFLDKKNPVYTEFATSLFTMGIASVTFTAGISEEEIQRFHKVITTDLAEIKARGGIEKVVQEMGISHIRPSPIDYEAFHFVEGERETGGPKDEEADLWEDYVYGLLRGRLLTEAEATRLQGIPPGVFAQMINRVMPEPGPAEAYENVITAYLHKSAEEKRLRKGSLGNVMAFIEGLKPSLKRQFLTGTFKVIAPDPGATAQMAGELTTDRLMQILKEINEAEEVVPDDIKNLLEKFSKIKQKTVTIDARRLSSGEEVIDDIQLTPEVIKLFEKDKFGDYITDGYRQELKQVLATEFPDVPEEVSRVVQEQLGGERLDTFMIQLLMELVTMEEGRLTDEEVQKFTQRFVESTDDFLETGQFDELSQIWDVMTADPVRDRYPTMAAEVVGHMTAAEYIQNVISFYRFWGRKNRGDVIEFSKRLKTHLLGPIFTVLIDEQDAALRSFYMSVLGAFGLEVVPLALERLSDPRWFVKRNMLFLLRKCGNRTVLKHIKPYCEHKDLRVALEAIEAYLHFGDNDGLRYIKQHLLSSDREVRDEVIKIIGAYRVKLLVPELLKLLARKEMLGGDFHLKLPIVKTLGEIGDERAVKYLLEIVQGKSMLYKQSLDILKRGIYQSLRNYPLETIKPLIEEGIRSKEEDIVRICRALLGEKVRK